MDAGRRFQFGDLRVMTAITLLELQGLRDDLVRALAKGILTVTDQNSESVTYAGPGAMQRAIAVLEARIAAMQSGSARNTFIFTTNKGLD